MGPGPVRPKTATLPTLGEASVDAPSAVKPAAAVRVSRAPAGPGQLDIQALRAQVLQNPEVLANGGPEVFENRLLLKSLLSESGQLLQQLPPELRADRELVEVAVRANPNAMEYASPALKADKALGMLAVTGDGWSIDLLDPKLKGDREVALAAVTKSPWCLQYVSKELWADRDVVRTAALGHYASLAYADRKLLTDVDLMREVAQNHPLALEQLKKSPYPTCVEQLMRENPELAAKSAELKARADKLGIEHPERLGSVQTLETVLDNREHVERTDGRPLALMTFASSDYNGALNHERFDEISKSHRLLYYEVGTDRQLVENIKEATKAEPASLLMLGAHGTRTWVTLTMGIGEKSLLDLGDADKLRGLQGAVKPGANIVLKACDTGESRGEQPNVANLLAAAFPTAHVYAPTIPTNGWLQLGPQGEFRGPGYLAGSAYTYHVKPSEF